MAIEIVDFPMKNGGLFHSYVTVYQRVLIFRRRKFQWHVTKRVSIQERITGGPPITPR